MLNRKPTIEAPKDSLSRRADVTAQRSRSQSHSCHSSQQEKIYRKGEHTLSGSSTNIGTHMGESTLEYSSIKIKGSLEGECHPRVFLSTHNPKLNESNLTVLTLI